MRAVDIIEKKRDGKPLTEQEIQYLVQGYTKDQIPDYQMASWLMAVYFQGMNAMETAAFTDAMASSGDQLNLHDIAGVKVDKHSTGGVGDTTTLVLAPLVAAAGVPVAKMSGRGLGHTGGTIDKLESIPGFQVERTKKQFIQQVNDIGVCVMSQTNNIAPADKKLYALRDVTATVNSIPLIASSIMSKKIAAGADAIVLDVKTGPGAFMKTEQEAIALANAMVSIGKQVGRETIAVISSMHQPLGYAIGNALEIKEAIETLSGNGPKDLTDLCLKLGASMMLLAGVVHEEEQAMRKLSQLMKNGDALQKWKDWITYQGGDPSVIDHPEKLPQSAYQCRVFADKNGYIEAMESEQLGKAAMMLGAGRITKNSNIDLAAGIVLHKKIGDSVQKGEVLAELYWNKKNINLEQIKQSVLQSFHISDTATIQPSLILATINADEHSVEKHS